MLCSPDDGPVPSTYAFGMRAEEQFGHKVIRHGGDWVAFSTRYVRFPELELSVVVFCNAAELDVYGFSDEVAEMAVRFFRSSPDTSVRREKAPSLSR